MKNLMHVFRASNEGQFLRKNPSPSIHFDWHAEVGSASKDKQPEREKLYSKIGADMQDLSAEVLKNKEHVFTGELLSIQLAKFFGEPTNEWSVKNHKKTFDMLNRITKKGFNVDNPREFKGQKLVIDESGKWDVVSTIKPVVPGDDDKDVEKKRLVVEPKPKASVEGEGQEDEKKKNADAEKERLEAKQKKEELERKKQEEDKRREGELRKSKKKEGDEKRRLVDKKRGGGVTVEKLDNSETTIITTSPRSIESIEETYFNFKTRENKDDYVFISGPLVHPGIKRKYGDYTGGYVVGGTEKQEFIPPKKNSENFNDNNGIVFINTNGKMQLYTYDEHSALSAEAQVGLIKNSAFAFQNGPILLNDGRNPHSPNTKSKYIRSGMGWGSDGNLIFINSDVPMNMYEFGEKMREQGCVNAMFLDGGTEEAAGYHMKEDIDAVDASRRGFLIRR